jgi:D-lactate dehydrogenase
MAMTVADSLPAALSVGATDVGRAVLGADVIPSYSADLPKGGRPRKAVRAADPVAVYFPSCTNTMFGPVGGSGVVESFLRLCERAGVTVSTPENIPTLCCGTPWKSKGMTDGYAVMKDRVRESLRQATRDGAIPVVSDASSCTEGLRVLLEAAGEADITVVDAVAFVDSEVLPKLPPSENKVASVVLHPTCSAVQLGLEGALRRVGAAAAETVVVPDEWSCCGFAGDRGMLHPELTASATRLEAAEVAGMDGDAYASSNRTCELGMTRATGHDYEHILQVLDRATASDAGPE